MKGGLTHRYVLFCDEAFTEGGGLRFHHFYGGALVQESFVEHLEKILRAAIDDEKCPWELKWQNVDSLKVPTYRRFMDAFFTELGKGYFRVRVMCLDKYFRPRGLTREQRETQFHRLYYLFVTRTFGWACAPLGSQDVVALRLFLHNLPDTHVKNAEFKRFLRSIPDTARFQNVRMRIPPDGISEIDGKTHRIQQAVDTLIGALGFRLNRFDLKRLPNGRRGKRTVAKERLYQEIQKRLYALGVKNIGITTGLRGRPDSMWHDPVRIWHLRARDSEVDRKWAAKK